MKYCLAALLLVLIGNPVLADSLRPPLEKQFFEYFKARCGLGMQAEIKAAGKDPNEPKIADAIGRYCACTAKAIVSYLSAEEIVSFATDPEKEPAAGKMKPYFRSCHGSGGQAM
jgi:hypothetical protein